MAAPKKSAAKKAATKKAVAKKKVAAKNTQTAAKPSPKAKTVGKNMVRKGPLGNKNGSGSIPMQGSAPQSMGGIGLGGYGL